MADGDWIKDSSRRHNNRKRKNVMIEDRKLTPVQAAVLDHINVPRMARLAYDLVSIRSYTCDTTEATEFFAGALNRSGLDISWFRFPEFPRTPGMVARLAGAGGGVSLELNGHMDTIPLDHEPPRLDDTALTGRGATDMKASLACAAEVALALRDAGVRLQGDLLISTHGLHEMPGGHGEDLEARLRTGIHGEAVIVLECGSTALPVAGVGMCTFEAIISRPGEITHENSTATGTPHPIVAAARFVTLVQELHQHLSRESIEFVGSPSVFVGEIHGGDFYNRFPTECRVVGTRRWSPEERFADARAGLEALCRQVERETGTTVQLCLELGREGFRVDLTHPLPVALRNAYELVTGSVLVPGGLRSVADASTFQHVGGVPAVYHGPQGTGHHGDFERIELAELLRATRVLALTALTYCGVADGQR